LVCGQHQACCVPGPVASCLLSACCTGRRAARGTSVPLPIFTGGTPVPQSSVFACCTGRRAARGTSVPLSIFTGGTPALQSSAFACCTGQQVDPCHPACCALSLACASGWYGCPLAAPGERCARMWHRCEHLCHVNISMMFYKHRLPRDQRPHDFSLAIL
jgi:hypothetical protein